MAGTNEDANLFTEWLAGTVKEMWTSNRQFAEEAYIDPGGFSKILNRQTNFDLDTLKKIADTFERRREESGKGPSASEIVLRAFNLWGMDGRRINSQNTSQIIAGGLIGSRRRNKNLLQPQSKRLSKSSKKYGAVERVQKSLYELPPNIAQYIIEEIQRAVTTIE